MRIVFAISLALSLSLCAAGQVSSRLGEARAPGASGVQAAVRPVPLEVSRRSESLHTSLQPSARIWMQQQAQIEARRPALDLEALRTAIRRRFTGAANVDIETMVFMVMAEVAQNQEQDLRNQMQQMEAMEKEKQALRQLLNQMQQETAQLKAGEHTGVCQTPFCRSLPTRLAEMTTASTTQPRPFHLRAQENITYPQLSSLLSQTDQALGSVSDLSQEQQLQMQTAMDQRSKLIEMLSNMLKSMSDTSTSIIANMK